MTGVTPVLVLLRDFVAAAPAGDWPYNYELVDDDGAAVTPLMFPVPMLPVPLLPELTPPGEMPLAMPDTTLAAALQPLRFVQPALTVEIAADVVALLDAAENPGSLLRLGAA